MSEGLLTVHAVLILEGCREDDTPTIYKETYLGRSGGLYDRGPFRYALLWQSENKSAIPLTNQSRGWYNETESDKKKNYSFTGWGFSRKSPKAYPLYKKDRLWLEGYECLERDEVETIPTNFPSFST